MYYKVRMFIQRAEVVIEVVGFFGGRRGEGGLKKEKVKWTDMSKQYL